MREKPQIINASVIAQTRIFRVEELELEFSNKVKTKYERIKGNAKGAVLIVPILDDNTVLLIREYAAGTHSYELSFPKGLIEDGEEILGAANRELMEEVGYASKNLRHVTSLTIAPGYIDAKTHVVLAQELYEKRMVGDEPEDIEVISWRLEQIDNLLQREDFSEARSIAALYIARDLILKTPKLGIRCDNFTGTMR